LAALKLAVLTSLELILLDGAVKINSAAKFFPINYTACCAANIILDALLGMNTIYHQSELFINSVFSEYTFELRHMSYIRLERIKTFKFKIDTLI
jgi:hypothetical protein